MGNRLDEFLLARAVPLGQAEVVHELFRVAVGHEAGDRTRLRSLGDSSDRGQTCPNRTSSVKWTCAGAKSPNIRSAPDGSLRSAFSGIAIVLSCLGRIVDAEEGAKLE